MAWFEREFIAAPGDRKDQLVFKWPDLNIRRYTRAIVNVDEVALFVKSGQVVTTLGPGRHRIDADELPGLGAVIDTLTGGNFYRAELYFVSSREIPGIKFGGRLDDIMDPISEQVVTLRAFGEFALAVRDPAVLVTVLNGTSAPLDPQRTPAWCADLLLKSMKIAVAQEITAGTWPVLGLSAHLPDIEAAVLRRTNRTLYEYGLRIARMGNFDITVAPDDAERLKRLAKDTTYIRLTGDFQRYAAGELALGAGQGLAQGPGNGGLLSAALGMNALQLQTTSHPSPWTPAGGTTAAQSTSLPGPTSCPDCRTATSATARFCVNCGVQLRSPAAPGCTACGAQLPGGGRFCGECGTPAD